jgi:Mg2+ and Co2+ transporter CorA
LLTCAHCGGAITAERQKGHHYYRCSKRKGPCSLGYLREETLAEHLRESITQATVPVAALNGMIAEAKREMRENLTSFQDILASHRSSLSTLEDRLARLLDIYLDGSI